MCFFERGLFVDKEEARDVEGQFIHSLMNYLTNLVQHGHVVAEASNEKPHIFESHTLCMFAGDE